MKRREWRLVNDAGYLVWDWIEWWDREDFKGRKQRLYTMTIDDFLAGRMGKLESVQEVPDDMIICDFCNEDIRDFPVPVWHHHALCLECRKKIGVETLLKEEND